MRWLAFVLSITLAPCLQAQTNNAAASAGLAPDPAVDVDVQHIEKAMHDQDMGTMIDLMYPPIVQAGGGREALLAVMNKKVADWAAKSIKVQTFECLKPYTWIRGTTRDYVVVPDHTVMQIGSHHVDSRSFQLGIREHGSSEWHFITGTGMTPEARTRFFPDLPASAPLPTPQIKRVD